MALLDEIHRLKAERNLSRNETFSPNKRDMGPSCYGNMNLSDVQFNLQRSFMRRAMEGETVYHFLTLVKYRNIVEPSSMISIGNGTNTGSLKEGTLLFPNSFILNHLYPDFKIIIELYMLETRREFLPHEAKYHIKKVRKYFFILG